MNPEDPLASHRIAVQRAADMIDSASKMLEILGRHVRGPAGPKIACLALQLTLIKQSLAEVFNA